MKHRLLTFLAVIGALALTQCQSNKGLNTNTPRQSTWTEVTSADGSTPVARHEAAFVGVGDMMYLLGGRGIRPVSIYNSQTGKWTEGQKPPIELHHFQPFVYQQEIYVAGAMTGGYPGETPVEHMYIYSPAQNEWRKGPAIPAGRLRGGAGAVIDGDELYIVCGIKDGHRGDHKKWLDYYNFKTGNWAQLADAPRARDHFQAVIHNGKLYSLAGRTTIAADNPFKNTIKEVDVYDIATNSWTTLESQLPTERAGNFCTTVGNEILVIGGESIFQETAHSEVEALHTDTHQWKIYPSLPKGRHGTGAILHNNAVVIASGCGNRGGAPELSDMWKYNLLSN